MKPRYSLAFCFLLLTSAARAQNTIPNGSFENWTGNTPAGWTTTNLPGLVETVTLSTEHTDGSFAAHGEVLEIVPGTTVPPTLYSGEFDGTNVAGFPFTARPAALNGMITTDLKAGDAVFMSVSLLKNRQAVAGNSFVLTTSSAAFVPFSIPLLYATGDSPDTAIITITIANTASGSPTVGSSFTVDALAFGAGTGAVSDRTEIGEFTVVNIDGLYRFDINLEHSSNITLEVLDAFGRKIRSIYAGPYVSGEFTWDPAGSTSGVYLVRLTTEEGVRLRKLSVVR